MQAGSVPVSEAIISTVEQMFVLWMRLVVLPQVALQVVLLVVVSMLKRVLEYNRPSGKAPLHFNGSRPRHS